MSGANSVGFYSNNFGEVFSNLVVKCGISCYQISQFTNIDQGYLSKLKGGDKANPSPEIVYKIGLALCHISNEIKIADVEDLFNSIGRSIHVK